MCNGACLINYIKKVDVVWWEYYRVRWN